MKCAIIAIFDMYCFFFVFLVFSQHLCSVDGDLITSGRDFSKK